MSRKKLRDMTKDELIAYANSCPGTKATSAMTKKQIFEAIPWKFRDHDGEPIPEDGPKNLIEEPIPEPEPPLKHMPIHEAVRIQDNYELRRYISMDGHYRYGLTEEQIERADEIIGKLGCSKPEKREKQPIKSGF